MFARDHTPTEHLSPQFKHPLRVLIDARKVHDGGIGTYVNNLVSGLVSLGDDSSAQVSVGVIASSRQVQGFEWNNRVEIIESHIRPYSMAEYLRLSHALPLGRYDIFHAPHYTLPFGLSIPSVVTIHDLIHVQCPERFYYPVVASTLIRSAVSRARAVICVSEATGREVRKLARNNSDIERKVRVIPNAVRPALLRCVEKFSSGELTSRNTPSRRYVLAVLSMHKPHKGAADLLRAHQSLLQRGFDVDLILVGQGSDQLCADAALSSLIGPEQRVYCRGRVGDDELVSLYLHSVGLVVPSLLEGFCIPALEAISLGVPVVCRPVEAMLEFVGGDNIVCSDMSLPALEAGIERLLSATQHRVSRGATATVGNALPGFDYRTIALCTSEVYQRVYESCACS